MCDCRLSEKEKRRFRRVPWKRKKTSTRSLIAPALRGSGAYSVHVEVGLRVELRTPAESGHLTGHQHGRRAHQQQDQRRSRHHGAASRETKCDWMRIKNIITGKKKTNQTSGTAYKTSVCPGRVRVVVIYVRGAPGETVTAPLRSRGGSGARELLLLV